MLFYRENIRVAHKQGFQDFFQIRTAKNVLLLVPCTMNVVEGNKKKKNETNVVLTKKGQENIERFLLFYAGSGGGGAAEGRFNLR